MAGRRRKKSKSGLYLLLLVLAATAFLYFKGLTAPVVLSQSVSLVVPSQATTSTISQLLLEKGLIRSDWVFKIYAKIQGFEGKLRAGEYLFSGQVALEDIEEKMSRGEVITQNFTIPEGYNMEQMAELLTEKGIVNREKFLDVAMNGDFSYDYLPPAGTDSRLEGFLFPDTYQVIKGWSEEIIIQMMLKRFDDIFIPEWRDRAKEINMTIKEVVTLASIIEREARVADDRPIISSVFHNRMEKGMLLESCATVQYALGEVKEVLLYEDLKIDSPYNTYLNDGLPPGPIASPGKDSLKAALYPADSNYLYFVAKPDGSHYFSRTLAEHNQAKRKYLK
ncbi:MAG: endolytic transglycosylase MltG [Dehalobacterium sp.]